MGIYSKRVKSLNELKDNSIIEIPNDATNLARALLILETSGLIKLDKTKGLKITTKDIIMNKKNIVFKELEAALLPRVLNELDATPLLMEIMQFQVD